ncbi:LexA family protein [Pseudanabaena mucicola]|uniref:Translesion error-prone DNA polymerase V autoproteolytic subunit n=1 Tax=Pseudanabaena mucicola FACHB-723 TaxID=2692860 RepID=A0ABR8A1A6_9CYAN|nr:translesion error-prone DNA polymerase V autoproteolytic subunit [Pseudanabaena mucicola]MBD2190011.1 translesion error-prone DNA polymerase V autoproteolytic subunit [Pseudanabaena mucicola FACHB-723]
MPRGGKREGAGRPTGTYKYGEQTKAVRLPIHIADEILETLNHQAPKEPKTTVESVFKPEGQTKQRVPLYLSPIAAGFPAPTDDYVEGKIDLNRHLVKHPESTFLVRVVGESMKNAGIHPSDLLVVDRAIEPTNGRIVIAVVDGELTVKRLRKHRGKLWLMPENTDFQPIEIGENTDLHIWGVVTNVIHAL